MAVDAEFTRPAATCSVRSLSVAFPSRSGEVIQALREVSFDIGRGMVFGLVGESGSGKSMLGLSTLGLLPPQSEASGEVVVAGHNMLRSDAKTLARLRGKRVGLVLQDPTESLNPVRTIRSQLPEAAQLSGANDRDVPRYLSLVGLEPAAVLNRHPFELSGGMNQRVALAMALLQRPELIVADEPTTALDVTTQASILRLLHRLSREMGLAVLLISHDIGVIYTLADRVGVLYAGRLVEEGPVEDVVGAPVHPYTRRLIQSLPRLGATARSLATIPGQLTPQRAGELHCPFAQRCHRQQPVCHDTFPAATALTPDHSVWCWHPEETLGRSADD